jgi:hypothetical protein
MRHELVARHAAQEHCCTDEKENRQERPAKEHRRRPPELAFHLALSRILEK